MNKSDETSHGGFYSKNKILHLANVSKKKSNVQHNIRGNVLDYEYSQFSKLSCAFNYSSKYTKCYNFINSRFFIHNAWGCLNK